MPEPLAITVTDPLTFDEAVAVLCRYSLIERRREAGEGAGGDEVSGKGMLSMHRLVQVVARDWLAVEERQKWAEVAVRVVANIFPSEETDDVCTWPTCAWLLPHALAVAEQAEFLGTAGEATAFLLNQSGLYLKGRADFTGALIAYERALAIDETAFGPNYPGVAIRVGNLGSVLKDLGDLAGARAAYERALAIREVWLGPEHPKTQLVRGIWRRWGNNRWRLTAIGVEALAGYSVCRPRLKPRPRTHISTVESRLLPVTARDSTIKDNQSMPDHHPPHLYLDDTWYIVIAATLNHAPFLTGEPAKMLVRDRLKDLTQKFNLTLRAWVILDNHYHLLLKTSHGKDLSRFFAQLHGSTARQLNLWATQPGRQVWHNFWDTCIHTEADLWMRFNYIHHNPVKHGYVHQLVDWPFSSYHYYLKTKGETWLHDCWQRYPVIDHLSGEDFD